MSSPLSTLSALIDIAAGESVVDSCLLSVELDVVSSCVKGSSLIDFSCGVVDVSTSEVHDVASGSAFCGDAS